MAISTAAAKGKGRKLQQLVRDAILAKFPTLEPDDVRSCPMGSNGEDVQLSPAARSHFDFTIECKARAKIALVYDALAQAVSQGKTATPIAVIKADRKKPLFVIDLDDFMRLIR